MWSRALTFWDVAAPANSLLFVMVGVLLIVPVILVYVRFGATGTEAAPVQSALEDIDGGGNIERDMLTIIDLAQLPGQ